MAMNRLKAWTGFSCPSLALCSGVFDVAQTSFLILFLFFLQTQEKLGECVSMHVKKLAKKKKKKKQKEKEKKKKDRGEKVKVGNSKEGNSYKIELERAANFLRWPPFALLFLFFFLFHFPLSFLSWHLWSCESRDVACLHKCFRLFRHHRLTHRPSHLLLARAAATSEIAWMHRNKCLRFIGYTGRWMKKQRATAKQTMMRVGESESERERETMKVKVTGTPRRWLHATWFVRE